MRSKTTTLPISEVFYSIQGEGITTGVPAVFIRLGGCNLMCGGKGTQRDKNLHNGAKWRCDTIEVWMKHIEKDFNQIIPQEYYKYLRYGSHLIFTGGEPLLHQEQISNFLEWLQDQYDLSPYVEIETNGTIEPAFHLMGYVDQWNVSPKLSNSGNDRKMRYKPNVIDVFNRLDTQFKFVVSEKEDFEEILTDFHFIDTDKIVLMPSGETQEELNKNRIMVVELCKSFCVNYSDRLQIVTWNKKTGV